MIECLKPSSNAPDVTSPPWLAHKASHEGVIVAEIIAGRQENHELKKFF